MSATVTTVDGTEVAVESILSASPSTESDIHLILVMDMEEGGDLTEHSVETAQLVESGYRKSF